MSKINVNSEAFPNIVVAYLFDKLLHPDEVSPENELFNKLMKTMKGRGALPVVRDYYLNMDATDRMKYKIIKDGFANLTTSNTVIQVIPKKFEKAPDSKKKEGRIKKTIKKVLKALVASDEFTEDELELIQETIWRELQ
jgi:hypothetical protein